MPVSGCRSQPHLPVKCLGSTRDPHGRRAKGSSASLTPSFKVAALVSSLRTSESWGLRRRMSVVDLEPSSESARSDQPRRLAPVELRVAPVADEPPGEVILSDDDGKLSAWTTSTTPKAYRRTDPPTNGYQQSGRTEPTSELHPVLPR